MQDGRTAEAGGLEAPELETLAPEAPATEEETTNATEPEITQAPKEESARETAARVHKELTAKKTGGKGDAPSGEKPGQKPDGKPLEDGEKPAPNDALDPELNPPERLSAREKEVFNNLPKTLKRSYHRMLKGYESSFTKERQELARERQDVQSIREAVQPYMAEWGQKGFTAPSAIASLAAAQAKLTNPATKHETFIALGEDLGIDVSSLKTRHQNGANGNASVPDISAHPQFRAMQTQLQALHSQHEQATQHQAAQRVQTIVAEMATVKHEKDPASGRYLYPELHDEAFLDSVKPLVSTLVGIDPKLGYGEALRRAVFTLRGNQSGTLAGSTRPNFSPASTQTHQRAQAASISVRGRSAPAAASGGSLEAPAEALGSATDTARWAFEQLKRGARV